MGNTFTFLEHTNDINLKNLFIMLKNISNLGSTLNKKEQQFIKGGSLQFGPWSNFVNGIGCGTRTVFVDPNVSNHSYTESQPCPMETDLVTPEGQV